MKPFVIVGAGFSGAVLARQLVTLHRCKVLVLDERCHIAGNCYTERDEHTNIMVHKYGPHIFHTSREDVWQYVNQFCEFGPFVNRVKAKTQRGIFSLPINLHTINQFFGKTLNPREAAQLIDSVCDKSITNPANFEEQALRFIGRDLYDAFFYGYTKKQWGCEPTELPAAILQRLPIRFNYDDNYYSSRFQGIPREGYTDVIQKILNHPDIEVKLGVHFSREDAPESEHLFYTGELDRYFHYQSGRLGYRTVFWDRIDSTGDFQGNAVVNYTELTESHTRVHEHKHFTPWETHEKTIAFREYSKETQDGDIPYYPKRLSRDKELLAQYVDLAQNEEKTSFLGRLATYRYLDMHQVIGEALDFSERFLSWYHDPAKPRPVFSNL